MWVGRSEFSEFKNEINNQLREIRGWFLVGIAIIIAANTLVIGVASTILGFVLKGGE